MFVHLLLLILAINVIIFSRYFPDAFTGVKPERSPARRTVPEYVFQTNVETTETPDWSEPVEAETASRVVPQEQRQLPPVERTKPKLEMPKPRQTEPRPMQKFLMKRDTPSETLPQPTDRPARLARLKSVDSSSTNMETRAPSAPDVPTEAEMQAPQLERQVTQRRPNRQASSADPTASPIDVPLRARVEPLQAGARSQSRALPTIGQSGLQRQRQQPNRSQRPQPAGAAPAPPTVAVAREDPSASRMLAPSETPVTRQGQTVGAQMTMGQSANTGLPTNQPSASGSTLSRNELSARSGMPTVSAGQAQRAPGRSRRATAGFGFQPAGRPDPSRAMAAIDGRSDGETSDTALDRLASSAMGSESSQRRSSGSSTAPQPSEAGSVNLDLLLEEGPPGLANFPNGRVGVVPSEDQPQIAAAIDLARGSRPRRQLAGR